MSGIRRSVALMNVWDGQIALEVDDDTVFILVTTREGQHGFQLNKYQAGTFGALLRRIEEGGSQ